MQLQLHWLVLLTFLAVPPTLHAQARRAASIEKAVATAPDDGGMVAILLHGSDWNTEGEKFKAGIFDGSALAEALPGTVVLATLDCLESPSQADLKRREGPDKIPAVRIRTYPSILLLDGVGRAVAVIEPVQPIASAEELATTLSQWHQKIAKRDEMLVRARSASGVEQARLIGEALRAGGVGLGPWLSDIRKPSLHEALAAIRSADPGDESGWVFATEFPIDNIVKETGELREQSGLPAAEAELDRVLGNPYLTADQRQQLQRQRFLLYKADNQPAEKLVEILTRVAAEAPESILGRGATNWANYLRENPPGKK